MKTYYEILGISPDASMEIIHAAIETKRQESRRLGKLTAKREEATFLRDSVIEASKIFATDETRASYDRQLQRGFESKYPHIGIDFGGSNSAVAISNSDGRIEVLRNDIGEYLTPSVLYFEDENTHVVGYVAKDARIHAPARVIEFILRHIGTDYKFRAFGHDYSAVEISGIIFRKLKENAEAALNGVPIKDVVITCPINFDPTRRKAIEAAARLAGLNPVSILPESIAVAMVYQKNRYAPGHILVLQMGGSSLSCTVLRSNPINEFQVLAMDGDNELGGKDFDDAIMRLAIDYFFKETGYNLLGDVEAYATLRDKVEKAKRNISLIDKSTIKLSAGGYELKYELTRKDFYAAITGYIEYIRGTIQDVLAEAHLAPDDIQEVLLSGGSFFIPALRQMVEELFGQPPNMSINPEEAAVRGAAMFAEILAYSRAIVDRENEVMLDDQKALASETQQPRVQTIQRDVLSESSRVSNDWASIPIFISYKRLDWDVFVNPLVGRLRAEGFTVWVDQHLIEGGTDWFDEINEALRNCGRMILCISPEALESRHVKIEYRYFFNNNKKLYPIICREAELPAELQAIQHYPYTAIDKLIAILKKG